MNQAKPSLLYFGNKTSSFNGTKSVMETLEPLFGEFAKVHSASKHRNQILRILSMIFLFVLKIRRTDFVLIDVYSTRAYFYTSTISFLSRFFNKKYILILHGGNLPNRFLRKEKAMRNVFEKAYMVVAPSNYLKSFFDKHGINTIHIPNVIELANYSYRKRDVFNPKFISIRGFGEIYNPLMILKAMNSLKMDYPNLRLIMIGSKAEYFYDEIIRYIQEHSLENNVTVLDKMPKEDWIKLSEQADFMLSTPTIDNTPVSIIEGLALGLVIVSTNVGGIPFLLEDSVDSILVDSDDNIELAEKLKTLINNNDLCKSLTQAGRNKAELYDWNVVKESWKQIFKLNESLT